MSDIPAAENAAMRNSRLSTAAAVVRCVQSLAAPMDASQDMWQEFWDVVNSGAPYTDADLEELGITSDQLGSCVTVLENFNKFMKGETPAVNTYRMTVNTMRRVGAQL